MTPKEIVLKHYPNAVCECNSSRGGKSCYTIVVRRSSRQCREYVEHAATAKMAWRCAALKLGLMIDPNYCSYLSGVDRTTGIIKHYRISTKSEQFIELMVKLLELSNVYTDKWTAADERTYGESLVPLPLSTRNSRSDTICRICTN